MVGKDNSYLYFFRNNSGSYVLLIIISLYQRKSTVTVMFVFGLFVLLLTTRHAVFICLIKVPKKLANNFHLQPNSNTMMPDSHLNHQFG